MRTVAILPVKRFTRAKQRLRSSVADELRPALAAAMVGDVMSALAAVAAIERTILVTAERTLAQPAQALGAQLVADEREQGQSQAAASGIAAALAAGAERVLCVPGDCPAIDAAEIEALLRDHDARPTPVVVLPDRHGSGTNGLLLCPPRAIEPSFGEDSRARHLALARAAGQECAVRELPSLLLDIDTGADLAVLRGRLGELGERAERTRAVLGGPAFAGGAQAHAPAAAAAARH